MEVGNLIWLGYIGAAAGLIFAFIQFRKVMQFPEGNETMKKIAGAIREGSNAFLKRQYKTVAIFFTVLFVILAGLAYIPVLIAGDWDAGLVNPFTPFAFISGGIICSICGIIGMKVATYANVRTAQAATDSLNSALNVSFSSGTVMGFVVNGFQIFETVTWFVVLRYVFGASDEIIAQTMITFGMGVAVVAVFARVGGGIFTKAADVGADLVGKVEAGIPEDDPRNPAVIADNVGDNVGDVAGMGADLHQSNSGALVATIAIGFIAGYGVAGMLLPIIVCVIGVLMSIVGTFFVRTKEQPDQKSLLKTLSRGVYVAGFLAAILTLPAILFVANGAYVDVVDAYGVVVGEVNNMRANGWGLFGAVVVGIVSGFVVSALTEYYTSDATKPTRELAESSQMGAAPLLIGGLSLGMKSVAGPIISISVAVLVAFFISSIGGGGFDAGLYGIGLAAVAMLSTNAIILATDAFGPVADNAGGIAEMSNLPAEVRERTDALDSLGNTTAATGKGFAICSNAFTALVLLVNYVYLVDGQLLSAGRDALDLSVINPAVLIGFLCGAAMVFYFSGLCMSAVQRAAQGIVVEVRRQFKEIKGLLEGKPGVEADYATCVDICVRSALKEMIAPTAVAIISPVVAGVVLGAAGVVGFLAGTILSGFALAVFMLNSGGAWDNAKKYIERGNLGGKGSEPHKAAVIGDTVGDPLKDTAGPSFNNVMVLASTVAIVFAGVTVAFSLL
ncbi:MAG: sodium-translocating pyrophosphatase [Defluviitaleaceae bacterium]|nr:sodium-translocating pyrophosphatase [Defluviitaleaceae bacterium]